MCGCRRAGVRDGRGGRGWGVDTGTSALIAQVSESRQAVAGGTVEAGRAWMRAAVMSGTEPGSTSEIHSGVPSGADRNWMFPQKRRAYRSATGHCRSSAPRRRGDRGSGFRPGSDGTGRPSGPAPARGAGPGRGWPGHRCLRAGSGRRWPGRSRHRRPGGAHRRGSGTTAGPAPPGGRYPAPGPFRSADTAPVCGQQPGEVLHHVARNVEHGRTGKPT